MFADVSHLIGHNPPAFHYGVAVADLDADDRYEFVVAGFGGPNRVLKWTGNQLREAAPPDLADITRQAVGIAAGDLDGDGREELYILNTDTFSGPKHVADRLFKAHPDGRWEDLFSRPANHAARNLSAGRSVAVIDRRGVGRYGFFVANHGRPMRLYELSPEGTLADLAGPLGLAHATGPFGRGVLTLPLFSDHPDIFCVNEHGSNQAFRNRGDGSFIEHACQAGLDDPDEHGRGVTAFDDGRGGFGLCWGNWESLHRAMTRTAAGTWKDHATPGLAFPSAVRTVIAADFDNDGHEELFFNNIGEPNRLFRVGLRQEAGDRRQESLGTGNDTRSGSPLSPVPCPLTPEFTLLDPGDALAPDSLGTGAAVCDIDGDGVLELLVAHGERSPQPLKLFRSRTAEGNNWLRVRPLTRFGAPARGAVVRAEAGGQVRVKGVCGGSGYLCQMEPVAHFGLGHEGKADRVQVTWPDGHSVVLLNPGVNRTITVPYPRG